tara:strand:+ start:44 stop:331 length:288 start_codon:yes stop_codon:yes gene_type:complete
MTRRINGGGTPIVMVVHAQPRLGFRTIAFDVPTAPNQENVAASITSINNNNNNNDDHVPPVACEDRTARTQKTTGTWAADRPGTNPPNPHQMYLE